MEHVFSLEGETEAERLLVTRMDVRRIAAVEGGDHADIFHVFWQFRLDFACERVCGKLWKWQGVNIFRLDRMVWRMLMEGGQLDKKERHVGVMPIVAKVFDKQFMERIIGELSSVRAALIPDDAADSVAEPWVEQGVEQRRWIVGRCGRRHVVAHLRRIRPDREVIRSREQEFVTKPCNAFNRCLSAGYGEIHVIGAAYHIMIVRHNGDDVVSRMRHAGGNRIAAHVRPIGFCVASC